MTSDPDSGQRLGPFRIGQQLGKGGMGVVYQALDTHLNRQVALKVIAPHVGENPDFRKRFTREAQAQASLDSAHIVQIYSFGEANGQLYIASQLIPDGDLGAMINKHGSPPPRIGLNLIAQVADGLETAHAAGLIHRDIKPGNVLLRQRDAALHAYLADFGIARQIESDEQLTVAGSAVGTPRYMAPELHLGQTASPQTDVYSLGCLLWTVLAAETPYDGTTDYQIVRAHLDKPIPQLAETGPLAAQINRVLRGAMAKQPHDRYPSAAAFRDDLRRVLTLPDDPVPIRPGGDASNTYARAPHQGPANFQGAHAPGSIAAPSGSTPAPPAPPFRAASAQQAHSAYPGARPPKPGRGKLWAMLGIAAAIVAIGVGVTIFLMAGGSDESTGGGDDPEPSGREQEAIASIADGFALVFGDETGRCIGEELVEDPGVDALIEGGLLTDDLELDLEAEQSDEVSTRLGLATLACGGLSPSGIPTN